MSRENLKMQPGRDDAQLGYGLDTLEFQTISHFARDDRSMNGKDVRELLPLD